MSAGVVYRVAKWSECFENKKSQTYKNKAVHTMPLKFGLGFHRLMQMPDAAEIYGAWVIMTMLLAKQHPRDGWLTNNGKKDGEPLSPQDLSVLTNASASSFEKMLSACSAKEIGWLEVKAQSTMVARQSTMVDQQSTKVALYSDLDLDLDLNSHSDSTPAADAPGTGEREQPSGSHLMESQTMTLARQCADCRPEYARNLDGFYQVIRGFTSAANLADIIDDWCLDQANAEKQAAIPTKALRAELERRTANPSGSPPPPPWAQKKESAPRPPSLSTSPRLEPVDDPRADAPAGARS